MSRSHHVVDSPLGPLTLVADGVALVALHLSDERDGPAAASLGRPGRAPFASVVEQLEAYFAGEPVTFEDVQVDAPGTPFQREVWAALRRIPHGRTASYGEVARSLGRPGASRAVGHANGRNPVSVVVPCHRVVGADGRLTGFAGGLERKRQLLDLERGVLPEALPR